MTKLLYLSEETKLLCLQQVAKPLWRTFAKKRGCHHDHHPGLKYRNFRNSENQEERNKKTSIKQLDHGLDFTPLYKYILSQEGKKWDEVYAEIISRDTSQDYLFRQKLNDKIFNLVSLTYEDADDYVHCNENALFSGMYVNEEGILRKTNQDLHVEDFYPICKCCTHSFNGIPFVNEFREDKRLLKDW